MKKYFILALSTLALAACSSSDDKSETISEVTRVERPSDVEQGIVSREQSKVYSNLSVTAEAIVEKYENLDGVYAGNDDIEVTKLQDVTDMAGNEYTNNFRVTGDYAINGQTSEFSTMISFKEDDFDSTISILFYKSLESGTLVDVEMK